MAPARIAAALLACAGLACASWALPVVAADKADIAIHGTIDAAHGALANAPAGQRLVIKLFHPDGDRELDQTFRIVDSFELPLRFQVAPAIDMRRRTKWRHYVVEAYTDRDGDVLSLVAGELRARTPATVALGSRDITLLLEPVQ